MAPLFNVRASITITYFPIAASLPLISLSQIIMHNLIFPSLSLSINRPHSLPRCERLNRCLQIPPSLHKMTPPSLNSSSLFRNPSLSFLWRRLSLMFSDVSLFLPNQGDFFYRSKKIQGTSFRSNQGIAFTWCVSFPFLLPEFHLYVATVGVNFSISCYCAHVCLPFWYFFYRIGMFFGDLYFYI